MTAEVTQLITIEAAEHVAESPFYIPMTGPATRQRRSLKHDDTFIVLDSHGDIGASAGGPDGLFNADTRYLARLEMVLEDVKTGKHWRGIIKEGDPLLLIPGYEYHAARNPGPGIAQATMYATTPPRNEGDSYEHEPKQRLFPKRAFQVPGHKPKKK